MELDTLQQLVDESPFGTWWGLRVESAEPGSARVRLPFRPELRRLGGMLHGAGAMCAADVAAWIALIATVEGGADAVTVHLATSYLAPAYSDVTAAARVVKVGRRLAVLGVETHDRDGALVAIHQVTYARGRG